jgi:polysaccharide export outer membrane protein
MNTNSTTIIRRWFRLVVLLVGLTGVIASGQEPASDAVSPAKTRKSKPYKITNSDRLRIEVIPEDDLSTQCRVDTKGCVNLKYVGEVPVAGQTIPEAQQAIENAYRDQRYLRNPQVRINVEEYAPREVFISGEVKVPARYVMPIETVMTVVDLVQKAGGLTDTAKGTAVRVLRKGPDGKEQVPFEVNVESILKAKKNAKIEDNSLELEPGDNVFVPQRII